MIETQENTTQLPKTLPEFMKWEQPNDGFKYEWNDGEIIKFEGMNKKQVFIFDVLIDLFFEKGLNKIGKLIPETDVQLSAIQMRRPDLILLFLPKNRFMKVEKG